MGKHVKTLRPGAGRKAKTNRLTGSDMSITGIFLGSIVLCLVSYSTAVHPLDDAFVLWPALIGGAVGLAAGLILTRLLRLESPAFITVVLAVSGALLAVGLVLALNRPMDRSAPKHNLVTVVNKYERGGIRNRHFFLEISGFSQKQLEVEEIVYTGCRLGGQVDIITRRGRFGFPYLDRVQLISLDMPATEKLPEVPPAIPLPPLSNP